MSRKKKGMNDPGFPQQIQDLGVKFYNTKSNEVFTELYNMSHKYFRGIAYKRYYKDSYSVDHLISSFYLNLYEKIDQFLPQYSFLTWSLAIFKNCFNQEYRIKTSHWNHGPKIMKYYDEQESLEEKLDHEDLIKEVFDTIDNLPDPYKTILLDKYKKDLSLEEMADTYNVKIQDIKNGLYTSRKMLKRRLADPNAKIVKPRYNHLIQINN